MSLDRTGDRDRESDSTTVAPPPPPPAALSELLRPVRRALALAVLCQALSALVSIVPMIAVAELGRVLITPGPTDADRAWTVVLVGASALLVRLVFLGAAGGISHYADNDLQLHIRRRLAERLGRVPLGWYDERNSGTVKKAVQDDVSAMHHLVAHSLLDLTSAIVVPVASLIYLFVVDWRMTLVTLIPVVIGLALWVRTMSGYTAKMADYEQAMRDINGSVVEFVQGISVVKMFGQTGRAHQRFVTATENFARFFVGWMGGLMRVSAVSQVILSPVCVLLVVLCGGAVFIGNGWLAPADVLPFALLGLGLTAPLQALEFSGNEVQLAGTAAARVRETLRAPVLPVAADPVSPEGARTEFRGVRFRYDASTQDGTAQDGAPAGDDVLKGIDLVLEPGTVTALVGASGSGKSTLAKLLPRFYDVTDGVVSVGGADVRETAPAELYRRVAFVFQDVRLLRASVRDNILLGRPDAGERELTAAARAARIHDRILRLPRGYESVIGEDAVFSGGEAQRLSIARALLLDADILVLDEATAYADPDSETAIQAALSELVRDRGLLVIAHRLSTITAADRIVVLDAGRVVESGRHEDLLAADGHYARLWRTHQGAVEALTGPTVETSR